MENDKIQKAIEDLHEVLKNELGKHVVSCEIFISASEYHIDVITKTPDQLDMDGVSMRNIAGEWVK